MSQSPRDPPPGPHGSFQWYEKSVLHSWLFSTLSLWINIHVSPITDKMSLLMSKVNIDDWNFWLSGLHLIKFLDSPSDVIFIPITNWVMGPFSSGDLTAQWCKVWPIPCLNNSTRRYCYQISLVCGFYFVSLTINVFGKFLWFVLSPSWQECLVSGQTVWYPPISPDFSWRVQTVRGV